MNKKHIARSFGKASDTYEQDAPVQKWTAGFLCDYAKKQKLQRVKSALEIGCGTGYLTREMTALYPDTDWTITDLSREMVEKCQSGLSAPNLKFCIMDGEHPETTQRFDLIVSSLAVQWFHDLPKGLERLVALLNPGGRLIFSTLGRDTFKEWRDNLAGLNMPSGLHTYPTLNDVQAFGFKGYKTCFTRIERHQPYESGLDFLKALKTIGAQAPAKEYKALSAGQMRKVIKTLEETGDCTMTYDILIGDIRREA